MLIGTDDMPHLYCIPLLTLHTPYRVHIDKRNTTPAYLKPAFCFYETCTTYDFWLLGRRQANLCFHFAGSGENLPDITKSRDASLDNDFLALSSRS